MLTSSILPVHGPPSVKRADVVSQVLFWKKRGEEAVQRSGIPYTIVRCPARLPGHLAVLMGH